MVTAFRILFGHIYVSRRFRVIPRAVTTGKKKWECDKGDRIASAIHKRWDCREPLRPPDLMRQPIEALELTFFFFFSIFFC